VNCLAVRDHLPELSLAQLPARERVGVERHLGWCAACRKESAELDEATAILGFTAEPAEPPAGLQDRVVSAVRSGARSERSGRRTWRLAIGAAVAVGVLVTSGVVGGVFARDSDRGTERAQFDDIVFQRWRKVVLEEIPFRDPKSEPRFARLDPPVGAGQTGEGYGFVMAGPEETSFAGLHVVGLEMSGPAWPLEIWLATRTGEERHLVGRIRRGRVDESGSTDVVDQSGRSLKRFGRVIVRDAGGDVVLSGILFPDGA
jgi:hypothetical protein